MSNKLNQESATLESAPGTILRAITPADNTALPLGPCRAVYVGTAGSLAVIAEDDSAAVTLSGVQSGQILPIRCRSIQAAGTSALNIVAIY